MKEKIQNIINKATELKNNGITDLEVAKYVHLKLGDLLIYDNSYTENYIKDSSEKKVTEVTKNRQKMLLEKNTDISNRKQICKGMAEIYAGILDKVGIETRVIGVEKKGQIDGCKQEDGTIYEVAEKYKSSLDDNLNIVNGKNEKNNENEAKHYYALVKTEYGEYTQDFLIDKALPRIKTGEASLNDELPGFCKKEEYETKAKAEINELELSQEYIEQIKSEYEKFTDKPSDEKAFEFIFEKIKENNSKFGFEESKDYMMSVGMDLFSEEFNPKRDLKIVNLVKEDEQNCDIASIYSYGENNYLLRGGNESTQIEIPIGRIESANIKELQEQGFEPRNNEDRNKLNEITVGEKNTINKRIEVKKQKILSKQRDIYQGNLEREENNGNIHKIDLSKLSDEELQQVCFHYSLKKDKNSIDKDGLKAKVGRNSEGIDKLNSIYFSYGLEGALETWDVWLKWRANRLYSPYWQEENKDIIEKLENDTATEQEKKEYYYKAKLWNEEFSSGKYREDKEKMDFLFDFQMDEMQASNYYLLDLKEGKDFSFEEIDVKKAGNLKRKDRENDMGYKIFKEMYGPYSDYESSKVDKWNMNTFLGKEMTIEPDRIKQLTLPNGKDDVLSVIEYLYDKYKEMTPKEEQVQFDVLNEYMEYAKEKMRSNELQRFDRNDRINEYETISYFHDHKSDLYLTEQKIGKATVNTPSDEKEKVYDKVEKDLAKYHEKIAQNRFEGNRNDSDDDSR